MAGSDALNFIDNDVASGPLSWAGGRATWFNAAGDWNGATLNLEVGLPNGAWAVVASAVADGTQNFELAAGRLRVQEAGGPASGVYSRAVKYSP